MTTPTSATAPPALSLSWALVALLREWTARLDAAASDMPHGTRGFQVLSVVVHDTPPTQAALAARLGIDRTVMTYLIDKFVECDLVERQQDPADRRARRIVATEHGREVLAKLDARVAVAEQELLAGLDPADRDQLRTLLERAASGVVHDADRCATAAQGLAAG